MIAAETRISFAVPQELEAKEPPEVRGVPRDRVRLLVTSSGGSRVDHARFDELPSFLRPGDLLVANDSATLPAALRARRQDGNEIGFHLSTQLGQRLWVVEPRRAVATPGELVELPGGATATILRPYLSSSRLWVAELELHEPAVGYLHRWGKPITYDYVHDEWPLRDYQTVYAREPGSAEMPSAGRPFSPSVLNGLESMNIGFATLTLHTGVASLEGHELPYPEPYRIPDETVSAVLETKAAGGRVIAVGTTVVRALESAADNLGRLMPRSGWTDLVITPTRGVRVVDGLLTGFHEPEATHLAMLVAIAGPAHIERAYRAAVDGRYLWHEFGDSHLILPV